MPLTWSDEPGIAKALCAAYPETDRLALNPSALCALIVSLQNFEDAPEPPRPQSLTAILWQWMRFADEGEGIFDTPPPFAAVASGGGAA